MDESDLQGASPLPGQETFPKAKSRTKCWRAAFHSVQLLCCWARLWALGMDSEIPVGFVGLITHSKGMTSISLDFLGTCLQLERPCPSVPLQHGEAARRGRVPGGEGAAYRGPMPAGPRREAGLCPPPTPPRDNWRQPFLTCFSDLLSLGFPHVSQSEGKASCIPAGQQAGGLGIRTVGMGPS